MYKCLDCGNEDKFYGLVKEQGNALIFQNVKSETEPVPERQLSAVAGGGPVAAFPAFTPPPPDPGQTVRGNLWAIQNNGKNDEVTWAYLASEGSWKGFHEVRSCAVCHSRNIAFI